MGLNPNPEAPLGYTKAGLVRKMKWSSLKGLTEEQLKERKRKYQEEYKLKHPGRVHATKRKYLEANRKLHNSRCVKWAKQNKDRVNELARLRDKRNPMKAYLRDLKKRKAHPDKIRERNRNWVARNRARIHAIGHRRRARAAKANGANYTTHEHITGRWSMWDNKCYLCGAKATHTDHVKPLTKGGSHYPANLRPICLSCNSRKKDRWPIPLYVFTAVGAKLLPESYINFLLPKPEFTKAAKPSQTANKVEAAPHT